MTQLPPLITSLQNPRLKEVVRLRDRPYREQTQRFLIEGYREILRAASGHYPLETLFVCPEQFLGGNEEALISSIQSEGVEVLRCSIAAFKKMSYRDRPDGLLAIASQRHRQLEDLSPFLQKEEAPFLVVAEAIEKPGNLGTILRCCDAAAVHALLVCDRCTDIYNPNTVRASVGTLFTVPVVETAGDGALNWLKKNGIKIVAATPSASQEFTEADFTVPLAIAVGTEQLGLSQKWMESADIQVKIPMKGVADSLNVAMATALLLYEVRRQRKS